MVDSAVISDYSIEEVRDAAGQELWFSRLLRRDTTGHPLFELLDTVRLPPYDSTKFLAIVGCAYDGRPDPEIAALVANEDADSFRTVFLAWRADRRTHRIARLNPPAGVVCENAGWGAE